MSKMPNAATTFNFENLDQNLDDLKEYVRNAAEQGHAAHTAELNIFRQVVALGKAAFETFLKLQGDGDMGESVKLEDGRELLRLAEPHERPLQTIFGKFHIRRVCYGSREGQEIELVPLDTRLQLPDSNFSYVLQDWDQHLAVENPYGQVNQVLQKILGFKQPVDSLERMNHTMAEDVNSFRKAKPTPEQKEEGQILVMSADGKGIPMRKPCNEAPILGHRKRGEKRNKKKMATVGAVYTIEASPRTPEEVIESLFGSPDDKRKERPRPQNKEVFASLPQIVSENSSTETVFNWLELQARLRNPESGKPNVIIMDGQPSLWETRNTFFPGSDVVEILDLLHVTPRLWTAAHLFHPEGSVEGIGFVRSYLEHILHGEVDRAITNLKQLGRTRGLKGIKKRSLNTICKYLKKNKGRMRYDEYLKAGYPIASGVIEGACRHLIKDRMERAGMRWSEIGAQAMLDLRSVHLNEDWDNFMKFRIKDQTKNIHPHLKLVKQVDWPLAA